MYPFLFLPVSGLEPQALRYRNRNRKQEFFFFLGPDGSESHAGLPTWWPSALRCGLGSYHRSIIIAIRFLGVYRID